MELSGSRMRCVLAASWVALTFAGCNFGGDVRQGTDGQRRDRTRRRDARPLGWRGHWRFPPCALAKDTAISIARSSGQAPGGALSSVYDFGRRGDHVL